ncbi:hypothetical protein EVAR_97483_1 [Eumeta japonica]|uniref:Uncharacterized protein n=1 Tax=Eumeta variegata TaxID=151549 RepID=A0A4C1Z3S0_EUMVA|nr:hypothetical protein EVAR_97483_1 [Eumeta japonica]
MKPATAVGRARAAGVKPRPRAVGGDDARLWLRHGHSNAQFALLPYKMYEKCRSEPVTIGIQMFIGIEGETGPNPLVEPELTTPSEAGG